MTTETCSKPSNSLYQSNFINSNQLGLISLSADLYHNQPLLLPRDHDRPHKIRISRFPYFALIIHSVKSYSHIQSNDDDMKEYTIIYVRFIQLVVNNITIITAPYCHLSIVSPSCLSVRQPVCFSCSFQWVSFICCLASVRFHVNAALAACV